MDNIETIVKAKSFLLQGKIILYPTDTIWGIGCDATNSEAIIKINTLKERHSNQPLLILVSDTDMLKHYVEDIPVFVLKQLNTFTQPTTIIYPNAKNLPNILLGKNCSIGIRVIKHHIITKLIAQFGRPLVSTSANKTGKTAPQTFDEIDHTILNQVDYVFQPNMKFCKKIPSDIFRIEKETLIKIR